MNKNSDFSIKLKDLYPIIAEKLKSGGTVTFGPHGVSMLPLIRQGKDSVTIKALSTPPEVGDVIFYQRTNGQFVLHRIIGRDSRGYVLCGDNQWIKEYGISQDMIIGVMSEVLRDGKPLNMNNLSYLLYKKTLPLRRLYLRTKNLAKRAWGKLKRTLFSH